MYRVFLLNSLYILPIYSLNLTCTKVTNYSSITTISCPDSTSFVGYYCCPEDGGCCQNVDGSLFWVFIFLAILTLFYFCISVSAQARSDRSNSDDEENGDSRPSIEPREFECPLCRSKILAPPAYSSRPNLLSMVDSSRTNLSMGNRTCSTCSANSIQTVSNLQRQRSQT